MLALRWLIEISPLGQKAGQPESLCVEASGWQSALLRARALRGDRNSLDNFSVDLLDVGVRAIDPAARMMYLVTPVPESAPMVVLEPSANLSPQPPAELPAKKRAPAKTVAFMSLGEARVASEGIANQAQAGSTSTSAQPVGRHHSSKPPTAPSRDPVPRERACAPTAGFSSAGTTWLPDDATRATGGKPLADSQPVASVPSPSSERLAVLEPPDVGGEVSDPRGKALPDLTVLATRQEQPSPRFPLSYREIVYAAPEGTTEDQAHELVPRSFEAIREELVPARPGKLINLAVFDHVFAGTPKRRPLVTLTWKDWKGQPPEVRYPRRETQAEGASSEPYRSVNSVAPQGAHGPLSQRTEAFATLKSVSSGSAARHQATIEIPVVAARVSGAPQDAAPTSTSFMPRDSADLVQTTFDGFE